MTRIEKPRNNPRLNLRMDKDITLTTDFAIRHGFLPRIYAIAWIAPPHVLIG